jgi:PAS domain S-box-containing protein
MVFQPVIPVIDGVIAMDTEADSRRRRVEDSQPDALLPQAETGRRRLSKAALRESEALYRSLFENNHAVMLLIDPDTGAIRDANPAACSYYGWSREELQQKNVDAINTLTRAEIFAQMELARSEKRSNFFFQHRRADGGIRDVEVYSGPLTLQGKTLLYSIIHDITERRRAEEALRQSEDRYRQIVEAATDAILVRSGDAIAYANPAALKLFRAGHAGELVGKPYLEVVHPDDRPESIERIDRGMKEKWIAPPREHRVLTLDGAVVHVESSGVPIQVKGQTLLFGVFRDITERRQAEEKFRETERKYRELADSLPQVIFEVDANGNLIYLNRNAYSLFGYTPEELAAGFQMLNAFIPEDRVRLARDIMLNVQGHEIGRQEYSALKKDGTCFPVSVHANRILQGQTATGLRGILIDLTEIRRAEEEKRKLEAQLQQAQKMEAIGALAGGIAHDFNNILAAIIGYTELALLNEAAAGVSAELRQALVAASRAKDLVKQILVFSRQAGEERMPVKVGAVVKEAVKFLRATIPSTIAMNLRIDESAGAVLSNSVELHQILMNLCTNAVHAIGEHGGVLEVAVQNAEIDPAQKRDFIELESGPYVRVSVRDTGHGMTPDVIERIFDPYFTTKAKGVGTGLGLAVVHGIVTKSGGAIEVQSRPGQGSTFHVYLPRVDLAEHRPAGPSQPLIGGSERILFVDDEKMLVDIGQKMLERLGYHVVARTSPIEALELLRAKPDHFDLVVTDQTMPGMTGDVLAMEVMRIRPDIPVVVCTGYSQVIDAERARQRGIKALVMKPILIHDIAAAIRKAIGRP